MASIKHIFYKKLMLAISESNKQKYQFPSRTWLFTLVLIAEAIMHT